MTAALRALMSGVIDYAGLFPPAKLPLEDAVREYLAIRESPEAWMLGAFVIPAARVAELKAWVEESLMRQHPLELSVLGKGFELRKDWLQNVPAEVNAAKQFLQSNVTSLRGVMWEMRLPADSMTLAERLGAVLGCFLPDFINEPIFCELSDSVGATEERKSLISMLVRGKTVKLGFKLRTGGLTPEAFPPVEELAAVIHACQKHHCRWKATAGLHHPLRHTDAQLGVKMHGFLNVLFAAVLAIAHSLPESEIAEILADEDAANFHVTDDGIRWRNYTATVAQIETTRRGTFQSFGSCSFAEPRDDLQRLGLL